MTENPFRLFWDLGYRRIIPVVPHNATLSPKSNLTPAALGKSPGRRGRDGLWYGVNMFAIEATEDDLNAWHSWGANLGLRGAGEDGMFFVDVDHTDAEAAKRLYAIATETLGPSFPRVGQAPKFALPYRLNGGELRSTAIKFDGDIASGAKRPGLDIIYDRPHMVAWGTHPKTLKPYHWRGGHIPAVNEIPQVSAAQVDTFLAAVQAEFPFLSRSSPSDSEESAANPERLRAPDLEALREAMKRVPNDERYEPRQEWINVAQALIGACGWENRDEAFEMFDEFSSRWHDYDPITTEKEFHKAKPSRTLGFGWLMDRHPDVFANLYFQPYEPELSDLATDMFPEPRTATSRLALQILSDDEIQNRPDPEWLIEGILPEAGFNILYGDPGSHKSFVAQDMGLHIATGAKDWHGQPISNRSGGAVLYIAGEGEGDFKLRLNAWKARNYIPGHNIPKDRFGVVFAAIDFRNREDVDRLKAAVLGAGYAKLSLVIIDTLARMTPGADENATQDMGMFVRACDEIRMLTGASCLAIHHSNKQGGLRGASALIGAADSMFKMTKHKSAGTGTLACEKMKAGPDNVEINFAFDKVLLGDELDSLVPRRLTEAEAKKGVCTPEMQDRILASVQTAWEAGVPFNFARKSPKRFGPRLVAREHDVPAESAEQWLRAWMEGPDAVLAWGVRDAKNHVEGLYVVSEGLDVSSAEGDDGGGVFG